MFVKYELYRNKNDFKKVFKMADQHFQNLHNFAKCLNAALVSKQNVFL